MKESEVQHQRVSQPTAVQQNKGIGFDAPQQESLAQLESVVKGSPQAATSAQWVAAADASPTVAAQRRMADLIRNSPAMTAQRKWRDSVDSSQPNTAQAKFANDVANAPHLTAQRQQLDSFAAPTSQQASEEPSSQTAQRAEAPAKPNHTGLPDNLKSGIESLSGLSMDNVKVHYNSSQPAQLNALAYAQGTDIHVAPGQEKHLPHEAWHVVQQAQGRVMPTTQMKGTAVNDDAGLEREADVMGGKAVQMVEMQKALTSSPELTRYSAIAPVTQLAKLKYQSGNWVTIEESPQGEHKPPEKANEGDTFDTVTGEHVRVEVTDNSQSVTTSSSPIITPSSSQSITPSNSQSITPSNSQSITPSSSQSITSSSSQIITPGSSQSITPGSSQSITPGSSQSITPSNSPSITTISSQSTTLSNQGIKRGREDDEGDNDIGEKRRKLQNGGYKPGHQKEEEKTNDTSTGTSSGTSTGRLNKRPVDEIVVEGNNTWKQVSIKDGTDCWELNDGRWHFTVFLDTGDMHLSCAKGARAGSQIGTFDGGRFETSIITKARGKPTIRTVVVDGTILNEGAQNTLATMKVLYAVAMKMIAPKYAR